MPTGQSHEQHLILCKLIIGQTLNCTHLTRKYLRRIKQQRLLNNHTFNTKQRDLKQNPTVIFALFECAHTTRNYITIIATGFIN